MNDNVVSKNANYTNVEVVESSLIKRFSYDAQYQNLHVEFQTRPDRWYIYTPVPKDVVNDFIVAESAGVYFNRHIKHNYKCITPNEIA